MEGCGGKAGPTYAGSAGGGAGGAVEITSFQIYGDAGSPVTYPVTVGTGAPSNTTDATQGQQGNPSSIDFSPYAAGPSAAQISIQSMGGGGGACADQPVPVSTGGPGGCGGGGNSLILVELFKHLQTLLFIPRVLERLRSTETLDILVHPFMVLVVVDQD